jgi:starch synthase
MEFFGNLNLMKTGLVFSDRLNTVSARYAEEIQSAPLGCGLEGVLQHRRRMLSGIINGADYSHWNPATDADLASKYTRDNFVKGKAACKAALQKELGLQAAANVPLVAFVGRLIDQKGIDLILAALREWLPSRDAQWVILGTGDPQYQEGLLKLAERFPQKLAVRLAFSEPLAHRIEGGADIFFMPSQYEPCGLNQLYSLKYGTVPVVRATGGLADTIADYSGDGVTQGTANGFRLREYSPLALSETLQRACELYREPEKWQALVRAGMEQDWSWTNSARQYVDLYQQTLNQVRQTTAAPGG